GGKRSPLFGREDLKRGKRDRETFIGKYLGPFPMVHRYEPVMVEIERFPVFPRDPQLIMAVLRLQRITGHLEPLLGLKNSVSVLSIYLQPKSGAPRRRVFDQGKLLAIPSEKMRARTLQTLFSGNGSIGFEIKFRLRITVAPNDPHYVCGRLSTQPEMHLRRGDQSLLSMQARPQLDLCADAEAIHPLIAFRFRGLCANRLPMIFARKGGHRDRCPAIGDADKIEPSVAVHVRDRMRRDGGFLRYKRAVRVSKM